MIKKRLEGLISVGLDKRGFMILPLPPMPCHYHMERDERRVMLRSSTCIPVRNFLPVLFSLNPDILPLHRNLGSDDAKTTCDKSCEDI